MPDRGRAQKSMTQLKVDLALVQKYNVPGPRYTSYPPATFFSDQVDWPALNAAIVTLLVLAS